MKLELFIAELEAQGLRVISIIEGDDGWTVRVDTRDGRRMRMAPA